MHTVVTRKCATSGRFASLMELYENNYMLIRLLIPGLRRMGETGTDIVNAGIVGPLLHLNEDSLGQDGLELGESAEKKRVYVSEVEGGLDLELSAIEHEKYTTTFNLTYRFLSDERNPREPDLMIRIYHDARTCEVMSGLLQGTRHGPLRTRDLTEGYRLNRFLQKWVRFCIRQGHSFKPGACSCYLVSQNTD